MQSGDFYVEPDNTTRGVTLHVSAFNSDDVGKSKAHVEGREPQDAWVRSEMREATTFSEEDEAQKVPDDPFFQLELTTIESLDMSAAQVAKSVVDFLNKNTAKITKVSYRKFTIKADIVFDNLLCGIKARVYMVASGEHCVEIQRRHGDTIAFNRFYQCLSQHMNHKRSER